jgi:ferredoxin-type protein NapF
VTRATTAGGARSRRWLLTGGAAAGPRRAIAIADHCIASAGVVCQACGDACPERAIRFPLRRGAPPLPTVDEDRCTGCGACAAVCPVGAIALPERRA